MKLVIFGLTVSSSWGNGHATLWRGLIRSLASRGHHVQFFERDVEYYRSHRDLWDLPGGELVLYEDWSPEFKQSCDSADVVIVTSYCQDALAAIEMALRSQARAKVFYDLDAPVTLDRLAAGEAVEYIPSEGLGGFDMVLSYTGGRTLDAIRSRLGAREVQPLYGHVDPEVHCPSEGAPHYMSDLSYLGTYAEDRQDKLNELFVQPARMLPDRRFLIGGAKYPQDFPWTENIFFVQHLPPSEHPAFYCSSRLTLNITREAMAAYGYCPSGRLFEAAACGAAIISDWWEGLDEFFTPGEEVLVARSSEDVIAAMSLSDAEIQEIGRRARERTLREHTSERRAVELESILEKLCGMPGSGMRHAGGSPAFPGVS